jgi:hypothetical protein
MRVTSEQFETDRAAEGTKSSCQPRCPVCSGLLVALRSTMRCSRCYFTICEGCGGESGDNIAVPTDSLSCQ